MEQSKNSKITNNKELTNINKFLRSFAKWSPFASNLVTPKGKVETTVIFKVYCDWNSVKVVFI